LDTNVGSGIVHSAQIPRILSQLLPTIPPDFGRCHLERQSDSIMVIIKRPSVVLSMTERVEPMVADLFVLVISCTVVFRASGIGLKPAFRSEDRNMSFL